MDDLRQRLVAITLEWERRFGVAPRATSTLSEYDAALQVGCTPSGYSRIMQGVTGVRKGFDFEFNGIRYQVKGNRPSGKRGSKVTKVPKTSNYDWHVLIWVLYDQRYDVQEMWQWTVDAYRRAFDLATRISPDDMRDTSRGATRLV